MNECTVLVADDEQVVLNIISRCLAAPGRTVLKAMDGKSALETALDQRPDLVILDLCMPLLDGSSVCRALREDERTRAIPIIILTGMSGAQNEEELLKLGADDYISKPFDISELRSRVGALLRRCIPVQEGQA
ncbi:MAG: response regulator [Elusimicrobiota bacterium]